MVVVVVLAFVVDNVLGVVIVVIVDVTDFVVVVGVAGVVVVCTKNYSNKGGKEFGEISYNLFLNVRYMFFEFQMYVESF